MTKPKGSRTCLANHTRSISHHITPLVIHSLGGGHTDTQTHTHAYIRTEVISINQARAGLRPARAWFKNRQDNAASDGWNTCVVRSSEWLWRVG